MSPTSGQPQQSLAAVMLINWPDLGMEMVRRAQEATDLIEKWFVLSANSARATL